MCAEMLECEGGNLRFTCAAEREYFMDERDVKKFLGEVRTGKISPEAALERLRGLPYEDAGFAKIDHHRALRQGYPEVIFGRGKTPKQVS